jgi:alpha-tubulin suppressor-like RCC1 family protein
LGREFEKRNEKEMVEIEAFEGVPILKLATGRNHVMALDTSGGVYTWGKNDHG